MIKLQDLTPSVYYNQSRDFQLIGRLFDIVLNSVKTNADLLYNYPISQNSNEQLIDLLTLTLGFKSRHNYNVKQLMALCTAFTKIIKNKGNYNSLQFAVNTLLNADGVTEPAEVLVNLENNSITVSIPDTVSDVNLFNDLLDYILPAGVDCIVVKEAQIKKPAQTYITTSDMIRKEYEHSDTLNDDPADSEHKYKQVNNRLSIVPKISESGQFGNALAGNTPGIIANAMVWKPEETDTNNNEGDN